MRSRLSAVPLLSALLLAGTPSLLEAVEAPRIHVWSAESARIISEGQLQQAVSSADYLIIGEIHDNPEHHRLQARLLAHFADHHDGQLSVGFEQLNVDQQPLLDEFPLHDDTRAETFGEAVDWADSGWPDYAMYQPLFAASFERGLPVVPLMFSPGITRGIFEDGVGAALPPEVLQQLEPQSLLSDAERRVVEQEMQDAHCGKLPESMLPGMVNVQIARDAFMAHRMVQADERAVVITGNGHARRDRGVPYFLQRLRPEARIVVVSLLETSETAEDSIEEAAARRADAEITDYTVFTPEQERSDPCLAFQ